MIGYLKIIIGSMYSGKTTELIKEYKRHKSVNLLYNSMMENKTRYKILRNIGLKSLNKSKILRKILLSQGMVIEQK